jgi:DNA polymerase II small subunit/DNA polymerase delta subunit B
MTDGITSITAALNANYIATSTNLASKLSSLTLRRLKEYDIDVNEVTSEAEATALIKEKEAEKAQQAAQTESSQNGQTYYDKQIISDAIQLASDLGLSVSQDTEVDVIMTNINDRLTQLSGQLGNNENMKKVVDEYTNRFDYIYAQYMNKGSTLKSEVVSTLDVMGMNGAVSTNL